MRKVMPRIVLANFFKTFVFKGNLLGRPARMTLVSVVPSGNQIVLIVVMGPSYIVYWKLAPKFRIKDFEEVRRFTKSDILKT